MKRIIILSLLVTFYGFGTAQPAQAIFCSNCSTIIQQFIEVAKGTISATANLATQANTYILQYKQTVLDPLQNALIAASLLKQQSGTINLITGAVGGEQLLKQDPEQWIKNQGLNAVKVSLNDITNANGVYSGSILASVVATYRNGSSLEVQLKSLTNSSIPKITQDNLCRDTNLTAVAKNDVMKSDGTYDQSALTARKNELYNTLCKGNPTTDQALGRKLSEISNQRPDVGGWDAWLAQTVGGDNAYTQTVKSQLAIAEDKAKKEQAARDDLKQGGGVASPSECKETVSSNENYGLDTLTIANAPCRLRQLTGSSAALQGQLQQALAAPMQKLIAADGWGILGTLSQLLSAKNTFDMMKNTFSSVSSSGSSSGTGGGNGSNTSNTDASSGGQDLTNNSETKEIISSAVETRLASYETSIKKLDTLTSQVLGEINRAEGYGNQIRSCYQGLVDDFGVSPADYQISPGFEYYEKKSSEYISLRNRVNALKPKIQAAYNEISTLRALVTASKSSQEIENAFNAFEAKTADGTLPKDTEGIALEGDYVSIKSENDTANKEGGEFYDLKTRCASLRSQLAAQQF